MVMFEQLHENLIEMWDVFDGLCKKYNIPYWLDSGCAIGAVREKDFIPWDDDIDVAIMRDDFNRLKVVLTQELDSKYKLVEPKDYSPYFFDFIPKLIDLTVPLRSETAEDRAYKNFQNRMSIDFIILDEVPDAKWKQKIIKFKCKFLYGLARSKRYHMVYDKKTSCVEKLAGGLCYILGKPFQLETLLKMYENNTVRYHGIHSNTIIRSNSLLYFIDFFPKESYKGTVYMKFHGREVSLPSGYDQILTQMYGDYMTPVKDYKWFVSHAESN